MDEQKAVPEDLSSDQRADGRNGRQDTDVAGEQSLGRRGAPGRIISPTRISAGARLPARGRPTLRLWAHLQSSWPSLQLSTFEFSGQGYANSSAVTRGARASISSAAVKLGVSCAIFRPNRRSMARDGAIYACQSCGAVHSKWAGQCSACGAWNSLAEEVVSRPPGALAPTRGSKARGLVFRRPGIAVRRRLRGWSPASPNSTGVCGGGVVPGSAILLAGDPGCRQIHLAAAGLRARRPARRIVRLHLRRGSGRTDPRAGAPHGRGRRRGETGRRDRAARRS